MNLSNIDIPSVLRRLADRRIEEAMREGKFDNLPGAGQPLDLEPMPAEENARLMWWAIRLLKQNDFIPDEIRWHKTLDRLRESLNSLTSENQLPALVQQINHFVHKINTLGTNALKASVSLLDLETERAHLRERLNKIRCR
ncbi:MAG TPA: DUF1992 domain-containing protein [Tepidisphaeraceae bacterium]|jgi:hypothetical protein|nr:DUF1992 domain-containing protein [Tepidisphaeraceae bacterium]